MSSASALSSRQRILISVIVISLSLVFIPYSGFPEAVLFFCGASTGAILAKEFVYNNDEVLGSGQQEHEQFESVSTGTRIRQTLVSPLVGKYLFIGIVVITLLFGGAVLFGGGIPFVGSGSSNTVSGTVYGDSGPAASQTVELTNQSDNVQLRTSTDSNGEFEFNTSEFNGPYTVSVDGYNSRVVADGDTDVKFGEPPGLLSGLPIIGSGSSDDQEATANNSRDTSSSKSGTDEGEQVFRVLNGTVVDSMGDPVSFATVTIEDGNGNQLTQEQETGQDGRYRYEDVPYEGDIENITLVWKASEEGYQDGQYSLDLGQFLENEEEGIERNIMLTQDDIDGG